MRNKEDILNKGFRIILYFLLLPFYVCFGQTQHENHHTRSTVNIYFDCDSYALNEHLQGNGIELHRLDSLLSDSVNISRIDTIRICASSSVEGNKNKNLILAGKRAKSIKDYIISHHPQCNMDNLFVLHTEVGKWENFEDVILKHPFVPYRKKILEIINSKMSAQRKEYRLRRIYTGKLWDFLKAEVLPSQRFAANIVIYTKREIPAHIAEKNVEGLHEYRDTLSLLQDSSSVCEHPDITLICEPYDLYRKYLFSLKTNLLFDALCVPNVSVEVPLSRRISLSGSWTFPWWVAHNDSWALELLYGELECRYWLTRRLKYEPFSGFFGGLYAGAGYYDFERNNTGYQGEFFIASGLSFGYSHFINKKHTLSMEYGLGIGFLKTKYRQYDVHYSSIDENHHLIRRQNGAYTWIGPTKAFVSLAWHFGKKGRRNHE